MLPEICLDAMDVLVRESIIRSAPAINKVKEKTDVTEEKRYLENICRFDGGKCLLMEAALYGQEETHPDVLTYDSREVKANTMFICKGAAFKETYLVSAIEKGAVLYISERKYETGKDVPFLLVSDIRKGDGDSGQCLLWLSVEGADGCGGRRHEREIDFRILHESHRGRYMEEMGSRKARLFLRLIFMTGRAEWSLILPRRRLWSCSGISAMRPIAASHLPRWRFPVRH